MEERKKEITTPLIKQNSDEIGETGELQVQAMDEPVNDQSEKTTESPAQATDDPVNGKIKKRQTSDEIGETAELQVKAMDDPDQSEKTTESPAQATDDPVNGKIKKRQIKDKINDIIKIHVKAMDGLVTVNSLFTVAVFVGLAFATSDQQSLENRPECNAGVNIEKRLIVFEVISFALFLFSSLVAKSLKFNLNVYKKNYYELYEDKVFKDFRKLNEVLLYVCPVATFSGCLFLMISMVDLLQIRLGMLKCGTVYNLSAAVCLFLFVCIALIFYFVCTIYAIFGSIEKLKRLRKPPISYTP